MIIDLWTQRHSYLHPEGYKLLIWSMFVELLLPVSGDVALQAVLRANLVGGTGVVCCVVHYWWNTVCIPGCKDTKKFFSRKRRAGVAVLENFQYLCVVMDTIINIKQMSEVCVGSVAHSLAQLLPERRVIVITDANIHRLYRELVESYDYIIVGHGEANKNLQTVQSIYNQLMEMGVDRDSFLLGIGGGIVTDITGFVAATYMRGLDFGFISTTVLGAVDASVGGKNGVNVADYKNMVGTFLQPRFVIVDIQMLATLTERERRSGMAEVVKAGVIGDAGLFELIEREGTNIYANDELMHEMVVRAIRLKADIVERDEREGGIRRLLNLGHTIAHAIEKCSHRYNHGEAVAIGLSLMAMAAVDRGMMLADDGRRVVSLLERLGFDLKVDISMQDILREVRLDKKRSGDKIRIVFPEKIGSCRIESLSFEEFGALFCHS